MLPAASTYAELDARSCFSLLRGASQPQELVHAAHELGLQALGLCDTNGLYGVARAWEQARKVGLKLLVGAELTIEGTDATAVLLVQNQQGYQTLCRLLTLSHQGRAKGESQLSQEHLCQHTQGLFALLPLPLDEALAAKVAEAYSPSRTRLIVHRHLQSGEREREQAAVQSATRLGIPIVASARPLYHHPSRKPVADVLACIRCKTTLDQAGSLLLSNAEASLQTPARMAKLFRHEPGWLRATVELADQCSFDLGQLHYRFPAEYFLLPGETADDALERLVREKLPWRYPSGISESLAQQIQKELRLIRELNVAPYFLSVYEIVEIARAKRILCQGRGSAANSAVCYVLGITAVDPARSSMLFERFMSPERKDPPDIDVDFEHERREEVIQEIYRRYGRDRAAMVAEVISYRGKSALRDVGKAFGLSLEQVDRLSGMLTSYYDTQPITPERVAEMGLDPSDDRLRQVLAITQQIQRFPRHLSIHVGGFVLSAGPLEEVAPVEPARMPGRTIVPWDKDDLDTLGFFKVDVLALGMLTCIRKALALVMPECDPLTALARIPAEDPLVYEALSRGDSLGVFQVESRAQMTMLPRLKPRCFYDLVIEVAIVRPGPIQGGMVHPYLRRRAGKEAITCPHPSLWPILKRSLGVPLFQEQVMQIAIVGAGYTGGEADQLRRDMAAWRKHGRLMRHRQRLLDGFAAHGISRRFGEQLFKQIEGFGEYGFPESHAASFALLVYASAWLKVHHPAVFACALINSQPMGFYSPSSIVRDAQAHGVEVLPIRVTKSDWDCTIEPGPAPRLRLGLRLVRGLGEAVGRAIEQCRAEQPFAGLDDLIRRAKLRKNAVEALAEAGALEDLVPGRRQALWAARAPRPGPLFDRVAPNESPINLPALRPAEQLILDYGRVGLSIDDHPMNHVRPRLSAQVLCAADLQSVRSGSFVTVAGVVINRQRPATASGIVFMTLEDETGTVNLVVRQRLFDAQRHTAVHARMLLVRGKLDRRDDVTHVVATRLERLDLPPSEPLGQMPKRSRDFH